MGRFTLESMTQSGEVKITEATTGASVDLRQADDGQVVSLDDREQRRSFDELRAKLRWFLGLLTPVEWAFVIMIFLFILIPICALRAAMKRTRRPPASMRLVR
jgi:hypothetical protein